MDEEEKIKELKEEIKALSMEVYGKPGDEIIELIDSTDPYEIFHKSYTVEFCRFLKRHIMKDKKKLEKEEVEK